MIYVKTVYYFSGQYFYIILKVYLIMWLNIIELLLFGLPKDQFNPPYLKMSSLSTYRMELLLININRIAWY